MKTALVHYWLVKHRGGEKVLCELAEMFPDADLFTHVYIPEAVPEAIRRMKVRTTWINRLPKAGKLYRSYFPLMPLALRALDLTGYDLILSTESGPAKGIRRPPGAVHICYCFTPMRYLWDMSGDYFQKAPWHKKLGMKLLLPALRKWDLWSATQVDHFVADSQFVAERIRRIYGRDANVIYPPVNIEHFQALERDPQDFYLFFGQLTDYKRADIAIEAFNRMGIRLVVAGGGECFQALEKLAGPTVEFLGRISDEKRDELYSQAKALIFPGIEDFGMVPVEAQAAGCPIIAFRGGGALETVRENETGIFFNEQAADSLAGAVERFDSMTFDEAACRANASKFSAERFVSEFSAFIKQAANGRSGPGDSSTRDR